MQKKGRKKHLIRMAKLTCKKHSRILIGKSKCVDCKEKLTIKNTASLLGVKDNLIGMSCIKCQIKAKEQGKIIFGRLN